MNITFTFNKKFNYNVNVVPSKVAVWEQYIPYKNSEGIYSLINKDIFVSSGASLSGKFRFESIYNNLTNVIKRHLKTSAHLGIPFNLVECGAGEFVSTMLIGKIVLNHNLPHKKFDVYDTFQGLPASSYQPELNDLQGMFSSGIDEFHSKMCEYPFARAIPGLIPDSLPKNDAQFYDFVHIDLDLYEGTKSSIEHFFPRLKKRGVIQLDDYNSNPWFGVNKAVDEFLAEQDPETFFFQTLPLGGAFIIKI